MLITPICLLIFHMLFGNHLQDNLLYHSTRYKGEADQSVVLSWKKWTRFAFFQSSRISPSLYSLYKNILVVTSVTFLSISLFSMYPWNSLLFQYSLTWGPGFRVIFLIVTDMMLHYGFRRKKHADNIPVFYLLLSSDCKDLGTSQFFSFLYFLASQRTGGAQIAGKGENQDS